MSFIEEKKFSQITTEEQAKQFLEELKRIENNRMHVEGDTTFIDYYNSKYQALVKQFPSPDIENLKHKEIEFKPIYNERGKTYLQNLAVKRLTYQELGVQYDTLQRYRYQKGDVIFDLITVNGKPFSYVYFSDNEEQKNGTLTPDRNDPTMFQDLGLIVTVNQDGTIAVSNSKRHENGDKILIDNKVLQEVPLGVTREEWDEEVEEYIREDEEYRRRENSGIQDYLKR